MKNFEKFSNISFKNIEKMKNFEKFSKNGKMSKTEEKAKK